MELFIVYILVNENPTMGLENELVQIYLKL